MLRSVGSWLVTDVSGQHIGPIFKSQNGTATFFHNVGKRTANLPHATSQKGEGLSYTAAEAWNIAKYIEIFPVHCKKPCGGVKV